MDIQLPATTVGSLPKPPTREGHEFAGWNMARDGSGIPFHEKTLIEADIVLVVYAQWKKEEVPPPPLPRLNVEVVPSKETLTPLAGERSSTFRVRVSGFKNKADADSTWLGVTHPTGLLLGVGDTATEDTKIFTITVEYNGTTAFPSGLATLRLNLNMPKGYEYADATPTAQVAIRDGLTKDNSIPVNQDNRKAFNDYANTPEGLKRHYQLTEDIELPAVSFGASNWTAIGKGAAAERFTGSFDGNGFKIFGLTLHAPDNDLQGLFGVIGEGAEVSNLGLEGGSVRGRETVGSLVGRNLGIVRNCVALNSSVTITENSTFLGRVVGVAGANTTLQNNHARAMTNYVPPASSVGANLKDGATTSAHNTENFWRQTLRIGTAGSQDYLVWNFNNVWQWSSASQLPILRGVGGTQNHTVQ